MQIILSAARVMRAAMAKRDRDGTSMEGNGAPRAFFGRAEGNFGHKGLACLWGRLVEHEVTEAVENRDGVGRNPLRRLHDVGMMAYDGIAACAGKGCCTEALTHGGRLLELRSPMQYGNNDVIGVLSLVAANVRRESLSAQLADVRKAVGRHPVLQGKGDAIKEHHSHVALADEGRLRQLRKRGSVAHRGDACRLQGLGRGA